MFRVSDSDFTNIVKSLGEDENSLNEKTNIIQTWMREQPHLPEVLDKRTTGNFLLLNKFSIEKTKQKIDNYFTVRTRLVDVYGELNPKFPHIKEFLKIAYVTPHYELLNNNHVVYFKIKNFKLADKLEPLNYLRLILIMNELRIREGVACGEIYVVDCKGVPLSIVIKFTPTLIYKAMVTIYEKVYSFRLKAIHIINLPPYCEKVIAIAKTVLKPKIFERIHIYMDDSILKEVLPSKFYLEDFGGNGISLETLQNMLMEEIDNNQKLFDHLDELKVNEDLRPEELKNSDFLGYYGSFKALDVD